MSRTLVLPLVHCCLLALYCLSFSHLTSGIEIPSVVPRHLAPHFNATAVINSTFTRIALSDYLTEGHWVVLLFYPFDFTFVCPTEIHAFSEHNSDFLALNTSVLAISTDSHHTHLAWIRTAREDGGLGHINIPLVADTSKQISRRYGVLIDDADDSMYGAALRALFIIDPTGRIRSMQINDDQVGRNYEEALRVIGGFQWAEQNDAVCPASWKQPGDSTLKPTPEGIKEFWRLGQTKASASAAERSEL